MMEGWIGASFNALNQPIAMYSGSTPPDKFLWFGYDPLGRCVKRWLAPDSGESPEPEGGYAPGAQNPAATYLYYDGWNLVQEGTAPNSPTRLYVHGGRVDEVVAQIKPETNTLRYFQYDARGHCAFQTDTSGQIMEQYEYDAFGLPYFYDGSGNPTTVNGHPGSPWGNRILFTGWEYLSDMRIYDFRNRVYHPELGRFLQPDPKHFEAGDYNLYRYCHNDPVNKSDPLGLDPYGGYANGFMNPLSDINSFQDRAEQGAGKNAFPFNSPNSLMNFLTNAPNITRLDLHGHGVGGAFFTGDPAARIYAPELNTLAEKIADGSIDIKSNSEIRLFACNQNSNAQYLSQRLGDLGRGDVKVTGAKGNVSPNAKETKAQGKFQTYKDGKPVGPIKRSLRYK